MYKVKVDEKLLCFTGSVNGMEYVTDPDVKLVVNGVDSFSFAIYPQHPLYREIDCKVSRVKIWRDSKLLFYGEVTGYSQDMYGIRTYDCEGALAWLNDLHFAYAISGATPKDVLYWYIKMYNQKLRDKSKSFELGTVTVHKAMTQDGTEGTIARSSGVYPSFWEEIQDKLLDSFGGILRVRYVGSDTCAGYIDWLAIPDGTCTQDVRYAKNLLNCDWTYDCTALATAVVPLGKRKDSSGDNEVRLTIDKADDDDATFMIQYMTGTDDLVKSGNMVYSKSRMEKYGLIQQTVTFDDITDAGTLAYQGAVWLRQNGKAASTIRAEAIDLADIDESVEHFTHGDYVRTKLPGDSAESLFPITAIEIPIAAPENAKLTVGTQESGITSGSGGQGGGQGGGSIADAGSGADALAHTHSNKGVLDKITEQDYADFKGAVNKAHIHANKDTLDKIDETAWLTVYGQSHEHDNKGVLDKTTASYTSAEKTKLAGIAAGAEVNQNAFSTIASGSTRYTATSKTAAFVIEGEDGTSVTLSTNGRATISSHSHSNKAVLDATTASYTTAEQTKLKGVSVGAEVNQNAFSTIATGSARYAATAKQSAFLIDGDGGTSVSLDTKTGRLTVSSHTHDNKAVLDQLDEEQWKFINGAANKAHVHDNKGTLDKITDVGWNTVYGYAHSHDNKSVLDKTTASYTAADKKKLDGIAAGATKVAVDSALSATSTNPVQNKAVKAALDSKSASGHTHAMITNSMLNIGGANNAAKWVCLGTLVSGGDARSALIRVWSGNGFNAGAYQNASFEIQIKDGYQSTPSADRACGVTVYRINCSTAKVKVIPTKHNTYTVWVYLPWAYWNGNYAVYGRYTSWVSQDLRQTTEPEGTGADTAYYDQAFLTSTVAKATEATTLTDSGWQKPTFPSGVKSSSIRYRKQGKIVSVTGYVQFSAEQTTITVFTLPTGYRPPAKIQQFNAVDSSAQQSFLIKIDTDGKVGFFGKTQGFFTTATEYYMHCTFFVD